MTGDPWRGLPEPLPLDAQTFCVEDAPEAVCGWGQDYRTGEVQRIVFVTLVGGPPLKDSGEPSHPLRVVMSEPTADKLRALLDHADHWACYERAERVDPTF
jgi:hypothetical protein